VLLGIGVLATNAFVLVVVGKLFASGYSEAAKGREASLAELAEVPFGLALGTAVFAGIYEEFVFRGFVQDRLRKIFAKGRNAERMGRTRLAIVVSQAALFAVGHGWQGTVGVVHAAVVGALFGVVSAWRGLRMAMAAHVTIDVVSFALLHLAMQ
jgi:membrane protease YdiL (CAAX protease family)